jgi:hypothetical protein
MIHASKLFPQALKEAFEEGERARKAREKRERKASDRGTIKRNKRKERAHVNLTEREKVQLTFNL